MAEPGDPKDPLPDEPARRAPAFDDDAVGFTSPAGMAGREVERRTEPQPDRGPEGEPQTEPAMVAPDPAVAATPIPVASEPEPEPEPRAAVAAHDAPPFAERPAFGRAPGRDAADTERSMPTFAIYVLILCAVPTLGVSAVIGLLTLGARSAAPNAILQSHYIYQARTLWTAAFAALAGLILLIVNLGVFVLFVLAVWTLARGAWGVLTLKAGQAIPRPRGWMF